MLDPISRLALARSGGTIREPGAPAASPPRVTVVIPCYNYGHFLPDCVASALDHDGVDVDVIIVDDASPDGSGDVAEEIAAREPRVSVIRHETNKRHLATYNDGFRAATGKYLVQLSADDLLPKNSLTRAVALLEAEPSLGFVYGYAAHFVGSPPPTESTVRAWVTWSGEDWIAARCRSGFNVIQTTEVVMRTDVVRAVGYYRLDLPHSGDLELWMRMATIAGVGFVAGPDQALYRLHDAQMHTKDFRQGTVDGQLVDVEHRWLAFQALFADASGDLLGAEQLEATARRTIASEALNRANYAFARGFKDFPIEQFEQFARDLEPGISHSPAMRALARRKRLGMSALPVHPLWAPRAGLQRLENRGRQWRRKRVGV
jgi:glycosyltransferase involved in cell wall biosynthesis